MIVAHCPRCDRKMAYRPSRIAYPDDKEMATMVADSFLCEVCGTELYIRDLQKLKRPYHSVERTESQRPPG